MSGACMFISNAQNLLTLTRYSGFDPEVSGIDSGKLPMTRTISLGLDIKF